MSAWQSWVLSTILEVLAGDASPTEQWAWTPQRYAEVVGSIAAVLMTIVVLVTYLRDLSSSDGLGEHEKRKARRLCLHDSSSRHGGVACPDYKDSSIECRNSRLKSVLLTDVLNSTKFEDSLKENHNESHRSHRFHGGNAFEDEPYLHQMFASVKLTEVHRSSKKTKQYTKRPTDNRIKADKSSTLKQQTSEVINNEKTRTDGTVGNASTRLGSFCKTWFTSFLTPQKNRDTSFPNEEVSRYFLHASNDSVNQENQLCHRESSNSPFYTARGDPGIYVVYQPLFSDNNQTCANQSMAYGFGNDPVRSVVKNKIQSEIRETEDDPPATTFTGKCSSSERDIQTSSRNSTAEFLAPFHDHGNVTGGVKRKRSLQENENHRESSMTHKCSYTSKSLQKPRATVKIRHPRSKRNRHYGWSTNARHHRSKSVPTAYSPVKALISFDLGVGAKSIGSMERGATRGQHENIMFSPMRSPCRAVLRFPVKTLSPKENILDEQKLFYLDEGVGIQNECTMNDDVESRYNCSKNKCVLSHPHNNSPLRTPKPANKKESPSHFLKRKVEHRCLKPTRYHAYFKPENSCRGQSNTIDKLRNETTISYKRNRTDISSKWSKCLTVDPENNIKCMVSFSRDSCKSGLKTVAPTMSSSSHMSRECLSKHKKSNYLINKKNRTKGKSPESLNKFLNPDSHRVSFMASPGRNRQNQQLSHSIRSRTCNLNTRPSDTKSLSHAASETSGESPDTMANVDILEAPVVCPVHRSPKLTGTATPPTVSLDSRQLVYLYRMALKKVGVGFRITPVSPTTTHVPQKCLDETKHYHSKCRDKIGCSGRHQGFPCKTQCSERFRQTLNPYHNLNGQEDDRQSVIEEMHTEYDNSQNKNCPQKHSALQTREVGKFGNESIYLFSSPSESSRSPRASPGHTNRTGLNTRSSALKLKKAINFSAVGDKSNSLSKIRQDFPATSNNGHKGSNYQFISKSPKRKSNREKDKKHGGDKEKKTTNQGSFIKKKERRLSTKRDDMDTEVSNNKISIFPYSGNNSSKSLLKRNKSIDCGTLRNSAQKKQTFAPEKFSVSTPFKEGRQSANLKFRYQNIRPNVKEKRTTDENTLNRLADVVEKLSNVLKTTEPPFGLTTVRKQSTTQQKSPSKKTGVKSNNVIPKSVPQNSVRRLQVTPKLSPSLRERQDLVSKHTNTDHMVTCKRRRLSQAKHLTAPPDRLEKDTAMRLATSFATTKKRASSSYSQNRKFRERQKTNNNQVCFYRAGPPQLRTAARAAAKTSVLESNNTTPREPSGNMAETPTKNRPKSTSHTRNLTCNMIPKSFQAARGCSVGTQLPSLHQAPLDQPGSVNLRRSPKVYWANRNNDLISVPTQNQNNQTPRSPSPPIRAHPAEYILCKRKSGAHPILHGSSSVPCLSWSVSVDTSWDVSASQVFD
ncbi:hypothetical protein ElyMa_003904000 [Elysia marginata]|uniref:Uncharacterized protein n=1 Tax=Elysia marginata TaxID=1093978 RepID=A0AAV4FR77_9GAST|nr:hypothetical protein ElyMa_003904000 [Elysia marginata]